MGMVQSEDFKLDTNNLYLQLRLRKWHHQKTKGPRRK